MNAKFRFLGILTLATTVAGHADPLTGWVSIFDPQNNNPRFVGASAGSDSPVTTDADQDCIMANFPSITLADEEFIIFSGTAEFDVSIPSTNFRVGLFNGPAVTQDVGNPYLGIYSEIPTTGASNLKWGPGTNGSHAFGGGTVIVPAFLPAGGTVPANTSFDFSLTITRDGDKLDIAASYSNASGFGSSNTVEDLDILFTKADFDYTFNSAGFLMAGSLDGNQGTFSNLDVTTGRLDSDEDGMLDSWELANGLLVGTDDSGVDREPDGLTNLQEYAGADGTPFSGDETNPNIADTDGDGIDDGPELTLGTDPNDKDSDGDFFEDKYEVDSGTLPTDPASFPVPDGGLFIDFSSNGSNNQDGPRHDVEYLPFVADHEKDTNNVDPDQLVVDRAVSYPVPAFTSSPTVTLAVAFPDTTDPRVKQLIGRTDALAGGGFASTYVGEHPDLMRDWIGIDSRAGSGGNGAGVDSSMTFTLSGIPAGTYQYRGYHHDVANMQSPFELALTDANGTDVSLGAFRMTHGNDNELSPLTQPGAGNHPSSLPSTIEFLFTSNGTDDIVITYAVDEDESTLFNSFLAVNGIEITTAVDTDNDGIPDGADLRPNDDDTGLSSDADTLTDLREYHLGTRLEDSDTDHDGFNDDVETNTHVWISLTDTGTSPWIADFDGDGLNDGLETNDLDFSNWPTAAGTNPFVADTDLDSYDDGEEANGGTDPTDPESFPAPPPFAARLIAVDPTAGTVTIEWNSIDNGTANYDIYASDTLIGDPLTSWTEVATFVFSTGTTTTFTETRAGSGSGSETLPSPMPAKRFYVIYEYR